MVETTRAAGRVESFDDAPVQAVVLVLGLGGAGAVHDLDQAVPGIVGVGPDDRGGTDVAPFRAKIARLVIREIQFDVGASDTLPDQRPLIQLVGVGGIVVVAVLFGTAA